MLAAVITIANAAFVISGASAIFAGVAAIFARNQVRHAQIANAFPAVIGMFGEYRSPHVSHARTQVFQGLEKRVDPAPLGQLPSDIRQHALTVCHYLDNFGVLVAEGLVDIRIAGRFLGDTAISLWIVLRPHIEAERQRRVRDGERGGGDYLRYFEDLATRLNELHPETVRANLKRWAVEDA
jgi:hypothetical protein